MATEIFVRDTNKIGISDGSETAIMYDNDPLLINESAIGSPFTVRVTTGGNSRSATYIITIGGSSSSQQVFALQGEQGYGTDYLSSVTPTGSGWRFNMNGSQLTHTLYWGIMRLGYNLI